MAPDLIRRARREDAPALVALRLANARAHVALDPAAYRIPDAVVVQGYFEGLLTTDSPVLILVAEVAGAVAGMLELVPNQNPPDHQIAVPHPTAEVHTVVLAEYRDRGIGHALLAEAERAAAERGIVSLGAMILTSNTGAVRFYDSAGFGPRGTWLRKELGR